jgi:hypothetical protein
MLAAQTKSSARPKIRPRRTRAPRKPRRAGSVSALLQQFAQEWKGDRVTVGDLVDAMEQRGHGMAMLVLSLPMLLPITPPGVSAIVGLPTVFVAMQLILQQPHVWLPGFLRRRSIESEKLRAVIAKTVPYVARVEKLLKPRLNVLTESIAEPLIGAAVLFFALLLVLPIPFTNIPLGLAIALLSMGLITRDGIAVLIGGAIGVASAIFMFTFGWSAVRVVLAWIGVPLN